MATPTGFKTPIDTFNYRSDAAIPSNATALTPELIGVAQVAWAMDAAAKTGAYTATDADQVIRFDCTSAGRTLTLPTAVGCVGRYYVVYKTDSSGNVITINTTSSQTVNGAASGAKTITAQFAGLVLVSDGANWVAWTLGAA